MAKSKFTRGCTDAAAMIYSHYQKPLAAGIVPVNLEKTSPENTVISFPENTTGSRNFDFKDYYGKGCDEICSACQHIIQTKLEESIATQGGSGSITTLVYYCRSGLRNFLPFCQLQAQVRRGELLLSEIDSDLIDSYIMSLSQNGMKYTTQRSTYSRTKAVLIALAKKGYIPKDLFPKNPYPNSNQRYKGQTRLSMYEHKQLTHAIAAERRRMENATSPLNSYDLTVCVLAIANSTGMNPTPIVELPVDCIQEHPWLPELGRKWLVSYKRRGNATQIKSLQESEAVVEQGATPKQNIIDLIELMVDRNDTLRKHSKYPDALFVYRSSGFSNKGQFVYLSIAQLTRNIANFIQRNKLKNDDGEPLVLNVMRLRKTVENTLLDMTDENVLAVADFMGHGVGVQGGHYAQSSPEQKKKQPLVFTGYVQKLRDSVTDTVTELSEETVIARCSDPKNGQRAPKNGEYCEGGEKCFTCRNLCVTGDTLHKLFSYYWYLKDGKSSGRIRLGDWQKHFQPIIRIIDENIAPQFPQAIIEKMKSQAKTNPYGYWALLKGAI